MEDGKYLPIISNKRECGTCTICCEGTLPGKVYGEVFGKLTPCPFVAPGAGCTIYDDRPENFHCDKFRCQWQANPDIPEKFKPNEVGFVTLKKGRSYFLLIPYGDHQSEEYVEWMKDYVIKNNYNLSYRYTFHGEPEFIGSEKFKATLAYSQKDYEPGAVDRDIRLADKTFSELDNL